MPLCSGSRSSSGSNRTDRPATVASNAGGKRSGSVLRGAAMGRPSSMAEMRSARGKRIVSVGPSGPAHAACAYALASPSVRWATSPDEGAGSADTVTP